MQFKGEINKLSRQQQQILFPSDQRNFTLSPNDLSIISISYYDFDGLVQNGEMIIHSRYADEVVEIFNKIFKGKFPIYSIHHIDHFNHCDNCSMYSNNSYSFCHRTISGRQTLSWHSFGLAIDINPLQNPLVIKDEVIPKNAQGYENRNHYRKGMITEDTIVYQAFAEAGWDWGGHWNDFKDYHHFQKPCTDLNALRDIDQDIIIDCTQCN